MATLTTIPITQARAKIFKIAEEVQKPDTHYTLTERGKPKVVLMSADEFESWSETLEVIRDFPDIEQRLKNAQQDLKTGRYSTLEEVLIKEGYIVYPRRGRKVRA